MNNKLSKDDLLLAIHNNELSKDGLSYNKELKSYTFDTSKEIGNIFLIIAYINLLFDMSYTIDFNKSYDDHLQYFAKQHISVKFI